MDIVSRYTQTFLWLQRYDEGLLNDPKGQAGGDLPTADEAMNDLNQLKVTLIERGEATQLFARLREAVFAALVEKPKLMDRKPIFERVVEKLKSLVSTFDDDMGSIQS